MSRKARREKQCPICGYMIRRGQVVTDAHSECVIMARGDWASAYPPPSEEQQAAYRKAEMLNFLRTHGKPTPGA